jgi:hypothetical protein
MTPKSTTELAIRKAVVKIQGTKFDLHAAVILYRINGYDNAMEYVDGIKNRREASGLEIGGAPCTNDLPAISYLKQDKQHVFTRRVEVNGLTNTTK